MTENKAPFCINRTLTTNNVKEIINIQNDHFAATSILIQIRISNGESGSKLSSFHKNSEEKKKQKLSEPTNSHHVNAELRKRQQENSGAFSSALPVVSSIGPGPRLQARKATTHTKIWRPVIRYMPKQELRSLYLSPWADLYFNTSWLTLLKGFPSTELICKDWETDWVFFSSSIFLVFLVLF